MNKRVQFVARRAIGSDVVMAATGVAEPVPFGGLAFALVLLGLMLTGATTRSWWVLVAIGVLLAVAVAVVVSGRNRRVLVGVIDGRVEVHRLRMGFFASGPIATGDARELIPADTTRALLLYLAPGGLTQIAGIDIALNQPLE